MKSQGKVRELYGCIGTGTLVLVEFQYLAHFTLLNWLYDLRCQLVITILMNSFPVSLLRETGKDRHQGLCAVLEAVILYIILCTVSCHTVRNL